MSKKRKVRIDRIIILALLGILVTVLLGFGVYKLIDYVIETHSEAKKPDPIDNQGPVETNDDVKISLVDYEVYLSEEDKYDFNFIIAELNFKGKDPVSFDLGNLQTSEKVHLNDVSKYLNTLNEKGYHIDKLDYVTSVVSDQKEYDKIRKCYRNYTPHFLAEYFS